MKASDKLFAIDANVILRYLLRDDEKLSSKAAAIMEAVEDGKLTVSCDPVILAEVIWVLTSFYKLPRDMIGMGLEPILKADSFIVPNKDRYIRALKLYPESVSHFGDACACAAALEDCDGRLLSFDRKLSGVDGINRMESIND